MQKTRVCIFCLLLMKVYAVLPSAKFLPAFEPVFAPGFQGDKLITKWITTPSRVSMAGSSLQLNLYQSSLDMAIGGGKYRIGGINVTTAAGQQKRQLQSSADHQVLYHFSTTPGLIEKFQLCDNGRVQLSYSGQAGIEVQATLSLLNEFFGNTDILVDSQRYSIPPYDPQGEPFSRELHNGAAKSLTFFPDTPDKCFKILLPEFMRMRFSCNSSRYGISITFRSAESNCSSVLLIEPGLTTETAQAPEKYRTHVGNFDFWKSDRLRLPDARKKNLLQNNSFEQGFLSLFFHQFTGGFFSKEHWTRKPFAILHGDAWHGTEALRILSDAPKHALKDFIATHPVMLTPDEYTFSVYAKTDRPGQQRLRLTFVHMPPGSSPWDKSSWQAEEFVLTSEWQRYSISAAVKVVTPQFFLLSADSELAANCLVDAMQLEKGTAPSAYEPATAEGRLITSAPDNLVEFGQKVNARLQIRSEPGLAGSAKLVVRDFFGRIRYEDTRRFRTGSDGLAILRLPLDHLPRGIFVVESIYSLEEGHERYEFSRFAIMSFLKNQHRHKNLFANVYIDPYGPKQFFPEVLERYRKIGIGSRAGFVNHQRLLVETANHYGVDSLSIAAMLRANRAASEKLSPIDGVKPLVLDLYDNIVGYAIPELGKARTLASITLPCQEPAAFQQIEDAAAKLVKGSPWIKVWSPLGEPEGFMPNFAHCNYASPENYQQFVELELALLRGIKRGNPAAMAGSSSTSCIRPDRFQTLDRLLTSIGNRFRYDCFVNHLYREAPEYPDLDQDLQNLFALLAKHGYPDTPVYCPEAMHWKMYRIENLTTSTWGGPMCGPYSYDMSYQEKLSSAWRARTWLVGLKNHHRIKVMNSSANFTAFEMDPLLTPYATQKISNTLGHLLGDSEFVEEIKFSARVRCYLFEDEQKRPVAAIWSCDRAVDRALQAAPELHFKTFPAESIFDLMEEEYTGIGNADVLLPLSPFPLFVRGNPGTVEELRDALATAELIVRTKPAASTSFRILSPSTGSFSFSNKGKSPFAARLLLGEKGQEIRLAPEENHEVILPLPSVLQADRIASQDLSLFLQQTAPFPGEFTLKERFQGVLVRKSRTPIVIDGDLSDWKEFPELSLTTRLPGSKFQQSGTLPDDQDFSARLRLAWDADNLYLAVQVTDDRFVAERQDIPAYGWRNDSLQIFLDTWCDARSKNVPGLDENDYSYGIYLRDSSGSLYVYRHHVPDMQLTQGVAAAKPNTVAEGIPAAFSRTDDGYVYELSFPLLALQPLQLSNGQVFGLAILLNDQDDAKGQMPSSHLILGSSGNPNGHPELWPLLMLVE